MVVEDEITKSSPPFTVEPGASDHVIADVTLSRSLAVISHAKIESLEVSREDVAGDEEKQWGGMGEEIKR